MASRAGNAQPQRAAQNQQTLKTLVKVETNKSCADCKRNKHPRWASWNLGIFVCIRCSGIHRGMGTHISRVKSVDLDAWTDEQLASMLRWGNARANKYWEAKLAPGHMPSEAKIENFIRTKYEMKRWTMDGPMPDPSTLDAEGDDEVPLNVVQEKAKLERSESLRKAPPTTQARVAPPQSRPKQPEIDLFGDDPPLPARSSSAAPAAVAQAPPSQSGPAPSKPARTGDSLLGFDFFGGHTSEPNSRPASASPPSTSSNVPSRPDLKQSILSLYSSAARTPSQSHSRGQTSISGTQQQASSSKDLSDAFGGLSFSSPSPQASVTSPKVDAFASLASPPLSRATPTVASPTFGSGGGFFAAAPAAPPPQTSSGNLQTSNQTRSSGSGFGDFSSTYTQPSTTASRPAQTSTGNGLSDLLDFGGPTQPAQQSTFTSPPASAAVSSPFNLSQPKPSVSQSAAPAPSANMMISDPWGSNDAWASKSPQVASTPAPVKATPTIAGGGWDMEPSGGGWGSTNTTTTTSNQVNSPGGDDFGGWESNVKPASSGTGKPAANFNDADLFSNVWE